MVRNRIPYYGGLSIFDDAASGSVTRELVVARVNRLVATQLREQACRGLKAATESSCNT
jgi:hypothetical protein